MERLRKSLTSPTLNLFLIAFILILILCPLSAEAAKKKRRKRRVSKPPWYHYLSADLGGSYKSILGYQNQRQDNVLDRDTLAVTEQRIRLHGHVANSWLRLEFADELSIFAQQPSTTLFDTGDQTPASWWDTSHNFVSTNDFRMSNRLDRAFLQFTIDRLDVTVGKQVVGMGVGRIFTAVSQTPRYPFIVIDPEYPITEDAISVFWNGHWTIGGRFMPTNPDSSKPNFHLRTEGSRGEFDVGLTLGQSNDKQYIGIETAGNLGDSVIRGEFVGYEEDGTAVLQTIVGFDRVFSAKFQAEWEVFYNGFGKASANEYSLTTTRHRSSNYQGLWYAGMRLKWEATPLLNFHLTTISNLNDPSFLFHLLATYSINDNMELIAGHYSSYSSSANGEFGGKIQLLPTVNLGLPDMTYLVLRWYF